LLRVCWTFAESCKHPISEISSSHFCRFVSPPRAIRPILNVRDAVDSAAGSQRRTAAALSVWWLLTCIHDAIKLACMATQSFATIGHPVVRASYTTTTMTVLYIICVLSSLVFAQTGRPYWTVCNNRPKCSVAQCQLLR